MASSTDLNDDAYIASLLVRDARDCSIRYSALGLQALLPKRPTNKAPRPNTRFLKNIIRETDNHNAALKKKEELEARMRARNIPLSDSRSASDGHARRADRKRADNDFDRGRMSGRYKRRRFPEYHSDKGVDRDDRNRQRRRPHHKVYDLSEDYFDGGGHWSRQGGRKERTHRKHARSSSESRSPSRSDDRRYTRQRRRSYSYSSDDNRRHRRIRRRLQPERKYEPPKSSEISDETTRGRNGTSHRSQKLRGCSSSETRFSQSPGQSSSSDPLESIVGPLPAVKKPKESKEPPPVTSRGRGANRITASAIDSHFDSSYNPSLDLHPGSELENEKEDWDMALEALRDRQLWKQKRAERLRAAGFGEDEVKKWEDSGNEKGAEDVRWARKGESREWDRGKVVESSGDRKGEVSLEAAWKR